MWEVHAFRDVIRNELANCAPQTGDKVTITYGGKSEKGYYLYRVRDADGRHNQVNWSRFSDDPSPPEPDLPAADNDLPKPPTADSPSDQAARFGDDVPWE